MSFFLSVSLKKKRKKKKSENGFLHVKIYGVTEGINEDVLLDFCTSEHYLEFQASG